VAVAKLHHAQEQRQQRRGRQQRRQQGGDGQADQHGMKDAERHDRADGDDSDRHASPGTIGVSHDVLCLSYETDVCNGAGIRRRLAPAAPSGTIARMTVHQRGQSASRKAI